MNREDIKQRVFAIIEEHLRKNTEITEDTLLKTLGFDSLDSIVILLELEMEFNIQIPDDDWAIVDSVSDIIRIVHKIKIP